jgi:hypothetical protein
MALGTSILTIPQGCIGVGWVGIHCSIAFDGRNCLVSRSFFFLRPWLLRGQIEPFNDEMNSVPNNEVGLLL